VPGAEDQERARDRKPGQGTTDSPETRHIPATGDGRVVDPDYPPFFVNRAENAVPAGPAAAYFPSLL
jgi:hypothetical protein